MRRKKEKNKEEERGRVGGGGRERRGGGGEGCVVGREREGRRGVKKKGGERERRGSREGGREKGGEKKKREGQTDRQTDRGALRADVPRAQDPNHTSQSQQNINNVTLRHCKDLTTDPLRIPNLGGAHTSSVDLHRRRQWPCLLLVASARLFLRGVGLEENTSSRLHLRSLSLISPGRTHSVVGSSKDQGPAPLQMKLSHVSP